jgi:hypothetical protein
MTCGYPGDGPVIELESGITVYAAPAGKGSLIDRDPT